MVNDSFSERYGYASGRSNLIFEDAPEQIRVGLREVLTLSGFTSPSEQRDVICRALRIRPDSNNWSYGPVDFEVNSLIHDQEWFKFYDMCERIARQLTTTSFEDELNKLLREEHIGYQMEEGKLQKVGSREFNQAVKDATLGLSEPKFNAALEQFEKALAFRNNMPPDYPNAVKEAVNSLEGTLQVVVNMPGTALPTLLSNLSPSLPSSLKKIYDGLYAYGSASEGARHAGVGGPVPGGEEAELIIHTSAAAIRHIIKTYR
jgi:hypothetical protein